MEQHVKGFKGFHAGEDVRPVTHSNEPQRTSAGRPMQSKIT